MFDALSAVQANKLDPEQEDLVVNTVPAHIPIVLNSWINGWRSFFLSWIVENCGLFSDCILNANTPTSPTALSSLTITMHQRALWAPAYH